MQVRLAAQVISHFTVPRRSAGRGEHASSLVGTVERTYSTAGISHTRHSPSPGARSLVPTVPARYHIANAMTRNN
jgi:hypothetical protein